MPGLPWVRLDANIYSHDKILQLKARRDGWRAIAVYMQSLAYAGGTEPMGSSPVTCCLSSTARNGSR